MELWLVGRIIEAWGWSFQGCFDSEEKARVACRDETYFLQGPFHLNENLPLIPKGN